MSPLIVAFLVAAEEPKVPDFWPMAKGNKWEYRATLNGKEFEFSSEVTEVAVKDGKRIIRMKLRFPGGGYDEGYTLTGNGLELNEFNGLKHDPPRTILRFPIKAGDDWVQKLKTGTDDEGWTVAVKESEEIKVPAGKFKATPVQTIAESKRQKLTATTWYAEGIGMVKMKSPELNFELKQFTPGK